ncbi:CRP-like cAMP-binding protein [Sphingomonas sp. PP-F2F-A104-K0414]|uniref:Crp/Fnr family transcriptional regulator n=1 Tax=Sphingomonas sp. PP-F2F-A104-K0414 TaxID=2135661 RepID=UPI001051106C|nr:Crp/Fnr family transcriptional regulator [Sphingomonas sp. PP-F2F-A104-K0414]TCP97857.1 CRP-like cAMP-binding protein [Sphingomonas sp. PP-F2F-A104-K0414]
MISEIDPRGLIAKNLSAHSQIQVSDDEALGRLKARTRTFESGSYVFREGLPFSEYAFVISGYLFRQKQTSDGHRQIVSLIIPGDIVNPENRFVNNLDYNVVCAERSSIGYVQKFEFESLTDSHPYIRLALDLVTTAESRQLREWLLNIGGHSARTRVAHFLNEFAARTRLRGLNDGLRFYLPMSQEQIGDAVGITPVHVNRAIRSLVESDLINHTNREYEIVDLNGFRQAGQFSERFLTVNNFSE